MIEPLKIVVVDDCAAVRAVLCAMLEAAGHGVAAAEDVSRAIDLLAGFEPDLIFTDYTMPGLTGADFLTSLRADPRFEATPVFVVSSEQGRAKRAEMEARGANGWIAKPIDARRIIEAVEAVRLSLEHRAAHRSRACPTAPPRPAAVAGLHR